MKGDYRSLFDLSGRAALVTGACGILGPHFCAALADHGARIAAVDLDQAEAEALAGRMRADYGVEARGLACDIADAQAVARMTEDVAERFGGIDILLNNAQARLSDRKRGLAPPEDYDPEMWRAAMAVNLDGLFWVSREVGRRMAERGRGSIIHTASVYGVVGADQRIYEGSEYMGTPIRTSPVYTAAKAGVIGLTRYLACHWAERGVRVNTLTPGGVESGQNEEFRRRYSARVPLGRMAQAEDLVGAVVYLASDASRYVTGQNLIVDGGLTAW